MITGKLDTVEDILDALECRTLQRHQAVELLEMMISNAADSAADHAVRASNMERD